MKTYNLNQSCLIYRDPSPNVEMKLSSLYLNHGKSPAWFWIADEKSLLPRFTVHVGPPNWLSNINHQPNINIKYTLYVLDEDSPVVLLVLRYPRI